MNIAYFRKSTFDQEKTIQNVKKAISDLGLTIVGETELPNGKGVIITACNPHWMENLIDSDFNLIGLLPCQIAVLNKDNHVLVGTGSATLLSNVTQHSTLVQVAKEVDHKLKEIVHIGAGVGPRKVVDVKLYSTMTCPYCKMEAAWLDKNKIKYDQVFVDLNPKEAEIMVQKTGQMGVPVTQIQYEDGEIEYVLGFDRTRLEEILIERR